MTYKYSSRVESLGISTPNKWHTGCIGPSAKVKSAANINRIVGGKKPKEKEE